MKYTIRNVRDLESFAERFVHSDRKRTATVLALSGELGAGKTAFVQALARALGVTEAVSSPTFVIQKVYELTHERFARLVHIDAYRLASADELRHLGWDELMADGDALVCIEWPERVAELVPEDAVWLRFEIIDEGRIISVNGEKDGRISS